MHLSYLDWRFASVAGVHEHFPVKDPCSWIIAKRKHGQAPFVITGRSMVVYVRYPKSPIGWVSIREIVQPASE
jgi:hypothetical protein